jgi:hypothetical protein
MFDVAWRIENTVRGEDRMVVRQDDDHLLVVIADGTGGVGGSAAAAQAVCALVLAEPPGQRGWVDVLREVDSVLMHSGTGGLSTGVVVEVRGGSVSGASVGDSAAWLVRDAGIEDLTERQQRKPLLGTGKASPIPFGPMPFKGRLLVASDGLVKYARRPVIQERGSLRSIDASVAALVDSVRLRSGRLQDDVAIVLAEERKDNGSGNSR